MSLATELRVAMDASSTTSGDAWGPVWAALAGGMVAAGATAVGTMPVVLARSVGQRTQDALFGFGAGVMLAASAFSLILPGIDAAVHQGQGRATAALVVGLSVLAGATMMMALERAIPHEHFIKGREGPEARSLHRSWLFVFAITLHNIPEGLAIGAAFAGTDFASAWALATGIAIQDVPEGFVVAFTLVAVGYRRAYSIAVGAASGLVEPLGAVLGAAVLTTTPFLLPIGLGFAAGAMIFVVSHEIIPESHREGHENFATAGLMLGFVLMMILDVAL